MKKFIKISIACSAFLFAGALPQLSACSASVCCNESCSIQASCTGTNKCHADGSAGTVTCDGARSSCGGGGGNPQT